MIVLLATMYFSWFESVPVFAEGRVEHQKRNQTATFQWPVGFVFGVQLDYSCRLKSVPSDGEKVVSNQVEHQKLNQVAAAATWLSFWCSTRLLMPEKKCPT